MPRKSVPQFRITSADRKTARTPAGHVRATSMPVAAERLVQFWRAIGALDE